MFECRHLRLAIRHKRLLNDICVSFASKKITAIIGANGAGKSTLLKALLGEYAELSGEVKFSDNPLASFSLKSLAKTRAYVSQHNQPSFSLAVFEYLLLPRELYEESAQDSQAIVQMAAELFGIKGLLSQDIMALSGGEAQLVEFTRAYLQLYDGHRSQSLQGKCLLLDEPASALDVKQTSHLYRYLLQICQQGATVILVDHDINAMAEIAHDILLIKQGYIVAFGAKDTVFTQANLNTCFDVNGSFADLHTARQSLSQSIYHVPISN
ncbi:ATP-binding cassette domain-containing protein [Ningiella sp. W23]|uniref:ATP-binding cassette domain-containing protein n=1 Tax=Ningiella sp. W23 TaxID=3023715 RepID=UPI00375700E2